MTQTQTQTPKTDVGNGEPVWLTDVEADVIYDVTRDQLENLGLDYDRGDGKNEWLPLTPAEFDLLKPAPYDRMNAGCQTVEIDGMEDMTIRLGQSCVWKGEKWLVPYIEIEVGCGPAEHDAMVRRVEEYVRDIVPLMDAIGGHVRACHNCVDVFVPMNLALQFKGSEDLLRALRWLTCPAALRDGLTRVMATFNTPASSPGYTVEWDATFDVLLEGRAWAESYLRGDRDEELTMHLAESGLAHKDAWALWNENWDLELDMDALRRLHSIR